MKTARFKLIIPSLITIVAGSCSLGASMQAQYTSMNVGCDLKSVKISDSRAQLNGTETWTARCNGKTYDCNYFPDDIANCYLRKE